MKVNIVIEYKDIDSLEEIHPKNIITELPHGKNTFNALDIPDYEVCEDNVYTLKLNYFNKVKNITFYYKKLHIDINKNNPIENILEENPNTVDTTIDDSNKENIIEALIPQNINSDNSLEECDESIYTIDLSEFDTYNPSSISQEIFHSIVQALSYVKNNKHIRKVIFPRKTYLIRKNNFINLDMKNLVIDFNNSNFQIEGLNNISCFRILSTAENLTLKNATFCQYKDSKNTNPLLNECVATINITGGTNLEFDSLNFINIPFKCFLIDNSNTSTNVDYAQNIKITNCSFNNNLSSSIHLKSGENIEISNNTFNDNNTINSTIYIKGTSIPPKNISINNNTFSNNSNNDILILNSKNITLENNSFTSNLEIWEQSINYKIISNKFYNSKILLRYNNMLECCNNTYVNSNLIFTNTGLDSKGSLQTINNESYTATTITSIDILNIVHSKFKDYTKQLITLNGCLNNCIIENGKFQLGASLNKCTISNALIENIKNVNIENSTTTDCIFNTNTCSDKFTIKNSTIRNCKLLINKYNNFVTLDIENNTILMNDTNEEFLNIVVGKFNSLTLKNNTIKNFVSYPIINISDSLLYTLKGKMNVENNTIVQKNAPYVIDGIKFDESLIDIYNLDNKIEDAHLFKKL